MRSIQSGEVFRFAFRTLLPMLSLLMGGMVGATAYAYPSALNPLLQEESPPKTQAAPQARATPSTAPISVPLKASIKSSPIPKTDASLAASQTSLGDYTEGTAQVLENEPAIEPSSDRPRSPNSEPSSSDDDGSWATSPRYSLGMPI